MKGTEIDSSNRGLERFKGPDCNLDSQGTPMTGQQSHMAIILWPGMHQLIIP